MVSDPSKGQQKQTKHSGLHYVVEQLEQPLHDWIKDERSAGRAVSRSVIKQQALKMNAAVGGDVMFKASEGWLEKFLKR
jgi:hypothetical protein